MKDLQKEIAKAVKSKTIVVGSKDTLKCLLADEMAFVAVSDRAENGLVNRLSYYARLANIPCHVVSKTKLELGSMCGKPYSVSAFGVLAKK